MRRFEQRLGLLTWHSGDGYIELHSQTKATRFTLADPYRSVDARAAKADFRCVATKLSALSKQAA